MSTHKTDTQQFQFDPGAMKQYQGLTSAFGNTAQGYMQNPFGNPFMQTQQQMGTRQAQNLGGTQMSDLVQNMLRSGMQGGASSPAGLEMQQNQARANTGMQANLGFLQPMQNALQQQDFFSQLASQFRPLQTGGKQTETTSGLGTWLPQLAGAGLGALGAAFGGGLPGGFFNSLGNHPNAPSGGGGWQNIGPAPDLGFGGAMPGGASFNMPMMGGGSMGGYGGAGTPPPMPGIFGGV